MMKESAVPYDLYTPLAEHTLVSVHPAAPAAATNSAHQVTLLNQKTGEPRRFDVSFCAILIGSRPDLRLLRHLNQTASAAPPPAVTAMPLAVVAQPDALATNWPLGRRLSWLKQLCSKCRSVPRLCEWSRRTQAAILGGVVVAGGGVGGMRSPEVVATLVAGGHQHTVATVIEEAETIAADDQRKLCGHFASKRCECPKMLSVQTTTTTTHPLDQQRIGSVSALQLGEDPLRPIDCKTNPIAVNKHTNEVLRTGYGADGAGRRGLYAMGPLVGDNFVRFIAGGALAITSALHREND